MHLLNTIAPLIYNKIDTKSTRQLRIPVHTALLVLLALPILRRRLAALRRRRVITLRRGTVLLRWRSLLVLSLLLRRTLLIIALRFLTMLLLWRSLAAVGHGHDVGALLEGLMKVADAADDILVSLDGEWNHGNVANGKKGALLLHAGAVIAAVVTLGDDALVALDLGAKGLLAAHKEKGHDGGCHKRLDSFISLFTRIRDKAQSGSVKTFADGGSKMTMQKRAMQRLCGIRFFKIVRAKQWGGAVGAAQWLDKCTRDLNDARIERYLIDISIEKPKFQDEVMNSSSRGDDALELARCQQPEGLVDFKRHW